MLVFDNTHVYSDERITCWSKLINYDKASNQFIIELGCNDRKTRQEDSVKVLMNVDEVEYMTEHVAIAQVYSYSKLMSSGKTLILCRLNLTLDDDKHICRDNVKDIHLELCDLYSYIELCDKQGAVFYPSLDDIQASVLIYVVDRNEYDKNIYELEDKILQQAINDCNNELIKINERNI